MCPRAASLRMCDILWSMLKPVLYSRVMMCTLMLAKAGATIHYVVKICTGNYTLILRALGAILWLQFQDPECKRNATAWSPDD